MNQIAAAGPVGVAAGQPDVIDLSGDSEPASLQPATGHTLIDLSGEPDDDASMMPAVAGGEEEQSSAAGSHAESDDFWKSSHATSSGDPLDPLALTEDIIFLADKFPFEAVKASGDVDPNPPPVRKGISPGDVVYYWPDERSVMSMHPVWVTDVRMYFQGAKNVSVEYTAIRFDLSPPHILKLDGHSPLWRKGMPKAMPFIQAGTDQCDTDCWTLDVVDGEAGTRAKAAQEALEQAVVYAGDLKQRWNALRWAAAGGEFLPNGAPMFWVRPADAVFAALVWERDMLSRLLPGKVASITESKYASHLPRMEARLAWLSSMNVPRTADEYHRDGWPGVAVGTTAEAVTSKRLQEAAAKGLNGGHEVAASSTPAPLAASVGFPLERLRRLLIELGIPDGLNVKALDACTREPPTKAALHFHLHLELPVKEEGEEAGEEAGQEGGSSSRGEGSGEGSGATRATTTTSSSGNCNGKKRREPPATESAGGSAAGGMTNEEGGGMGVMGKKYKAQDDATATQLAASP